MISTSKGEDFTFFETIPHLAGNKVFSDSQDAIDYLTGDFTDIFDGRGPLLQEARCRDIAEYNAKVENPMPPYVVVVDEFADLADQLADDRTAKQAFMTTIRRVAQLGRNRGIHLVLCTQRPSADLVPTNIRTLMNVRVAFRVNDAQASRMILNDDDAQYLQMNGDLLYKRADSLQRCQGFYTTTNVIESVLRDGRIP